MVVLSTPGWSVMSGEDPERRTDVGSSQTPARLGVPSTESTMSVPRRTTRPQLPDHCHQNAVVHPAAAAVHLRRLLQTACHQVTQVPSRPPAGRYPGLRVPKLAPRRPARRTQQCAVTTKNARAQGTHGTQRHMDHTDEPHKHPSQRTSIPTHKITHTRTTARRPTSLEPTEPAEPTELRGRLRKLKRLPPANPTGIVLVRSRCERVLPSRSHIL